MIVVHAPTWMRSPSASAISSPFPRRSSLSLRLVPLVDPRSVTVRPDPWTRRTACCVDTPRSIGLDAEVDAGLDALFAVGAADQCVAVQSDSTFREELGELDGVGSAAGDDALVVVLIGGDGGGPLDRRRGFGRLRRGRGFGQCRVVAARLTEATADRRAACRAYLRGRAW